MLKANTEDFQVFANFKSVPKKSSELDTGSDKVEYLIYNPHRAPIVPLDIRLDVLQVSDGAFPARFLRQRTYMSWHKADNHPTAIPGFPAAS